MTVVPFDRALAIATAALRAPTRHLGASLGDRACMALAGSVGWPMYTADKRLAEADVGVTIHLTC